MYLLIELFLNSNYPSLTGTEGYARTLKGSVQQQQTQYSTNNYSTIDSKKFIKTDNGLVYTQMGGALLMKKSTDALATSTEDTDRNTTLKQSRITRTCPFSAPTLPTRYWAHTAT